MKNWYIYIRIWYHGQDFGNFEESLCQGIHLIRKLEPVTRKMYLPQYFGNKFLLP